ncbi:hypothetical protein BCV70DRAFT_16012 [Testicularia cyperi]|uniref:Uncharacterized protein n=1 Tax=Testicularia cyperi TaxID=1882483 RepID=A0A317XZQ4_9BASI|nr:hypothetical protein BCV70DRAFT_16012 [Testicularia cyperi]
MSQSSIWARRMVAKAAPHTESELELNVLSLMLGVSVASLEDKEEPDSSAASSSTSVERLGDMYSSLSVEMQTAQTAVKAALDVLEESSLSHGLRISTMSNLGALGAPLSPGLVSPVSPVSPAESCFSNASDSDSTRRKGRARMSQEKRKRLARRREREALLANMQMDPYATMSLPLSPGAYSPCSSSSFFGSDSAANTPTSTSPFDFPSPALTACSLASTSASLPTPSTSPTSLPPLQHGPSSRSASPPTLVIQPPSPQRLKSLGSSASHATAFSQNLNNSHVHHASLLLRQHQHQQQQYQQQHQHQAFPIALQSKQQQQPLYNYFTGFVPSQFASVY